MPYKQHCFCMGLTEISHRGVPATILPAQEEARGCLLPVLDCSLFESAALAATIQRKWCHRFTAPYY